ncbi:hypothetical protein DYU11_22610 [Fibrisoma montanum]|uniref:F5/8 type C domain-containing protein n=2 Tax=Fibrisoma montanum TaxID=2305895 RepID=A0A418M235_9BACT|nr:hypothetical protein DYU11_22610 [Fibrisoma montanum]
MGATAVDTTGTIDITTLLQTRLAQLPAGATWKMFPGTYKLRTGVLNIPADRVTLDFSGSTLNVSLPTGANWTQDSGFVFDGNSKQGFSIVGGKWVCAGDTNGNNAYRVRVLSAHGCSDVTLKDNECVGCTLGRFPFGNNIKVVLPKGTNVEAGINYQQGGVESFLLFPYTTSWKVIEPEISGYGHGIHWDGGANQGTTAGYVGGFRSLTESRPAGPGRIIGGTIKNCSGGGIWGSLGNNIVASFVNVINCGDVDFDDEGGVNCMIVNSYLENSSNGGVVTTFGHVKGFKVINCHLKVSQAGMKLVRHYGSGVIEAGSAEDVTYDGCTFECTIPNARELVGPADGAFRSVTIRNCNFINTNIEWQVTASRQQRIENNTLTWTVPAANGISCGAVFGDATTKPELIVRGNRLLATAGGTVGITVFNSDGTYCDAEYIENNRIQGFSADFDLKATAASASVSLRRYMRNNTLGAGSVFVSHPTSGNRQVITVEGNRKADGTLWPKRTFANYGSGQTAFARTELFPASALIDGSTSGFYSSNFNTGQDEWVGVDLRYRQVIGEVVVSPRTDAGNIGVGWPIAYVIEISNDGGLTWSTVVTKAGQSAPTSATYTERLFFAPIEADQVRLRATTLSTDPSNGATVLQLSEFEVYAPGRPQPVAATGAATNGLPTGGTTGQVLVKSSGTDYASAWQTVAVPDTEAIQDAAAALLTGGTHSGISFTYDDANNKVNATVSGATGYVPAFLRSLNAAWACTDQAAINGVQVCTTNQTQLFEVYAERDFAVTHVLYEVSTPGSSLTANGATIKNGFVLMDATGNYLAHALATTDFGSNGFKRTAFNQTVNVTAGTKYYLALISSGTTPVALRVTDNVSGKLSLNGGRASAPFVLGTKTVDGITTGQLDITTGWTAKNNPRPWVALGATA